MTAQLRASGHSRAVGVLLWIVRSGERLPFSIGTSVSRSVRHPMDSGDDVAFAAALPSPRTLLQRSADLWVQGGPAVSWS